MLKNNTKISSMVEELEQSEMKKIQVLKSNEIKATKNILVIIVFFVLCWLVSENFQTYFMHLILIPFQPLNALNFNCSVFDNCDMHIHFRHFSIVMSHLNSAVNPLLYAYHLKGFKGAWKKVFTKKSAS